MEQTAWNKFCDKLIGIQLVKKPISFCMFSAQNSWIQMLLFFIYAETHYLLSHSPSFFIMWVISVLVHALGHFILTF